MGEALPESEYAAAMAECRRLRSEMLAMDRQHALRGMREILRLAERFERDLPEEMREPFAQVVYAAKDGIKAFNFEPRRKWDFRKWCGEFAAKLRAGREVRI